jgi:MYXO-CTERM domain-containing protein
VPECDRSSTEVQEATMFAAVTRGDVLRRTLAPDDVAGVCAIYPASSTPSCSNASGGSGDDLGGRGCSVGGGRGGAGLALLTLAGLALNARRRRRLG